MCNFWNAEESVDCATVAERKSNEHSFLHLVCAILYAIGATSIRGALGSMCNMPHQANACRNTQMWWIQFRNNVGYSGCWAVTRPLHGVSSSFVIFLLWAVWCRCLMMAPTPYQQTQRPRHDTHTLTHMYIVQYITLDGRRSMNMRFWKEQPAPLPKQTMRKRCVVKLTAWH